MLLGLAVGLPLGAAVAFGVTALGGGPDGNGSSSGWRLAVGVALLAAGAAGSIAAVVWMDRAGSRRAALESPAWGLGMRGQRAVARQIRAVAPQQPGDVPFLRDVAGRMAAQRPVCLLYASLAAVWGGLLLSDPAPVTALLLPAYAALAGYVALRVAWARTFLQRTGP